MPTEGLPLRSLYFPLHVVLRGSVGPLGVRVCVVAQHAQYPDSWVNRDEPLFGPFIGTSGAWYWYHACTLLFPYYKRILLYVREAVQVHTWARHEWTFHLNQMNAFTRSNMPFWDQDPLGTPKYLLLGGQSCCMSRMAPFLGPAALSCPARARARVYQLVPQHQMSRFHNI